MTISELIEQLSRFDGSEEVRVYNQDDSAWQPPDSIAPVLDSDCGYCRSFHWHPAENNRHYARGWQDSKLDTFVPCKHTRFAKFVGIS